MQGLIEALAFLTVVPVPRRALPDRPFDLASALPWFPLIGGVVGAAAGALIPALAPLVGRGPAAALAIGGSVALTGALHHDGLADTFDGLGVRGDRTRRLAVMRDPTVGTFGVLALLLWALLLLTSLSRPAPVNALRTLIGAEALARLAMLWHSVASPAARSDGLGALMPGRGPWLAAATIVGLGIAVASDGPARAGVGTAIAAATAALMSIVARRAVGGSTGDTLGATSALTTCFVCVAVQAMWS